MFQRTIMPSILVLIIYGLFASSSIFYFNLDSFAEFSMLTLLNIDMLFDADLAYDATLDFIESGLIPATICINLVTAISLISWFVFGEFVGIKRPGEARKYVFVWLGVYGIQLLFLLFFIGYFLHYIPDADEYLTGAASASIITSIIILNFLIFFLVSVLLSSRVIRTALPLSVILSFVYRLRKRAV